MPGILNSALETKGTYYIQDLMFNSAAWLTKFYLLILFHEQKISLSFPPIAPPPKHMSCHKKHRMTRLTWERKKQSVWKKWKLYQESPVRVSPVVFPHLLTPGPGGASAALRVRREGSWGRTGEKLGRKGGKEGLPALLGCCQRGTCNRWEGFSIRWISLLTVFPHRTGGGA